MLGEKSSNWGPHFMQWLMEIYETYARNGRSIRVPREVEANLQEQKDENSPFDVWLEENLIPAPGKRVHVHRFEKAYNAGKAAKDQVRGQTLMNKLTLLGVEVAKGTEKQKHRDKGCCDQSLRCVLDVNVKHWDDVGRGPGIQVENQ